MATAELSYKKNTSIPSVDRKYSVDDTSLNQNFHDVSVYMHKADCNECSIALRHTSTRDYSFLSYSVSTSQHSLSGMKDYALFITSEEKDLLKVTAFILQLQKIYNESSDNALVFIFDTIDTWNIKEDYHMFEKLFTVLLNKTYNEDVYISILASTLSLKSNPLRANYFSYVKEQLKNSYSEEELIIVLNGL